MQGALVLLLLCAAEARVATSDTPGAALGVGWGHAYAGLGLDLAYYFPLGTVRLVPHVGAGVDDGTPGATAGLALVHGDHHRVVVDVALAPARVERLYLHGVEVDQRTVWGPHAALGYEHMTEDGWIIRSLLGVAEGVDARARDTGLDLTFSVGMGRKFW